MQTLKQNNNLWLGIIPPHQILLWFFGMLGEFCWLNLWNMIRWLLQIFTVKLWRDWSVPFKTNTVVCWNSVLCFCSSSQCSKNSKRWSKSIEEIQMGRFWSFPLQPWLGTKWFSSLSSHGEVSCITALWWQWQTSICCERLSTCSVVWILRGICKLVKRYDKCLNLNGHYVKTKVKSCNFKIYIIKYFSMQVFLFIAKWSLLSKLPSYSSDLRIH